MITEVPSSTVSPPVKLLIENTVPKEIVIVLPVCDSERPDPAARVRAPISVLSDVTPPAEGEV